MFGYVQSIDDKLYSILQVSSSDILVYKGKILSVDSYSAFWDNNQKSQTELFSVLMRHNITRVFVCGLATDFCVSYTAVDAAEHGFETYMIDDASRGVSHDSIAKEKERMVEAGVSIIDVAQVSSEQCYTYLKDGDVRAFGIRH